jgi:hypothetical protein
MIQSPENPDFSLTMDHLGPKLTTQITTFDFGHTPKMFFGSLQTPY